MDRRVSTVGNEFFPYNALIEYEVGAIVTNNNRLYVATEFVEVGAGFTEDANFRLFDAYENLKLFDRHVDIQSYRTLFVHEGELTHDSNRLARRAMDKIISDLHTATVNADAAEITRLSVKVSEFDVSLIKDFSNMFNYAFPVDVSEIDFSGWNVRGGTNFSGMFRDAQLDTNNTMNDWDLRSATNVSFMFANVGSDAIREPLNFVNLRATNYNAMFDSSINLSAKINGYDMSRARTMSAMLRGADDIVRDVDNTMATWDLRECLAIDNFISVTGDLTVQQDFSVWDMRNIEAEATDFVQATGNLIIPVRNLPQYGQHVAPMTRSELDAYIIRYQDNPIQTFENTLLLADVSEIENFSELPFDATFDVNLFGWRFDAATDVSGMFRGAASFNQNIGSWRFPNVTNMNSMFSGCVLFDQDISSWEVSGVEGMGFMFEGCTAFNQPIGLWADDMSTVVTTEGMFMNATTFNQDLSAWDVSSVTNMDDMFNGATSFNGGN